MQILRNKELICPSPSPSPSPDFSIKSFLKPYTFPLTNTLPKLEMLIKNCYHNLSIISFNHSALINSNDIIIYSTPNLPLSTSMWLDVPVLTKQLLRVPILRHTDHFNLALSLRPCNNISTQIPLLPHCMSHPRIRLPPPNKRDSRAAA